jgi:hypothetical protein
MMQFSYLALMKAVARNAWAGMPASLKKEKYNAA